MQECPGGSQELMGYSVFCFSVVFFSNSSKICSIILCCALLVVFLMKRCEVVVVAFCRGEKWAWGAKPITRGEANGRYGEKREALWRLTEGNSCRIYFALDVVTSVGEKE